MTRESQWCDGNILAHFKCTSTTMIISSLFQTLMLKMKMKILELLSLLSMAHKKEKFCDRYFEFFFVLGVFWIIFWRKHVKNIFIVQMLLSHINSCFRELFRNRYKVMRNFDCFTCEMQFMQYSFICLFHVPCPFCLF